jgi:hypothetical protein
MNKIFSVVALMFLVACGSSTTGNGNGGGGNGDIAPNNNQQQNGGGNGQAGGNCSEAFLQDFNQLSTDAHAVQTLDDVRAVRAEAVQFKAKYQGQVCKVQDQNGQQVTIDVNAKSDAVVAACDKALANGGNPGPHGQTDLTSAN